MKYSFTRSEKVPSVSVFQVRSGDCVSERRSVSETCLSGRIKNKTENVKTNAAKRADMTMLILRSCFIMPPP